MVRSIIIFFLLLNAHFCAAQFFKSKITSDYIRIDQVGPRDGAMQPIIITTERLKLPFPEISIQVDKRIFESLSGYVKNADDLLRDTEINEFGVFKITSFVKGHTEVYFTGTRKKSVCFFAKFKKHLKDVKSPEELVQSIDRILAKIDY